MLNFSQMLFTITKKKPDWVCPLHACQHCPSQRPCSRGPDLELRISWPETPSFLLPLLPGSVSTSQDTSRALLCPSQKKGSPGGRLVLAFTGSQEPVVFLSSQLCHIRVRDLVNLPSASMGVLAQQKSANATNCGSGPLKGWL